SRAVRRTERVIFALDAPGEAAQPPALAQRADAVAPAGDDLVRIGLMADVPDQFVARRVEHIMKRDRQLDHTERRAQMPAGYRHRRNDFLAKLVGELRQLLLGEAAQVSGKMDRVEQRRFWTVTHRRFPYPPGQRVSIKSRPWRSRPRRAGRESERRFHCGAGD